METLSDEEFDHVRDFDMSDSESEAESVVLDHGTPSTTPPRTQTPRPVQRKILACPYDECSKTFNRQSRLDEHIRSHTGERIFKCPHAFCPKDFLRDSHLKHHLTSAHSDVRKYQCAWEGCDKGFATGTRLRRHIQAHQGREKYRCRGYEGCDETFRKHETLRRHVLTVHEQQKPFPCEHVDPQSGDTCSSAFDTADKLKSHKRAKHDSTKFCCTICITSHAAGDALMTTDEGDDTRLYTFSSYSELQAHIAHAHPPTCQHCAVPFTTNKELKRHLEIDHGVIDPMKRVAKQFPCTHPGCTHVFTKRGNLNVHIKTVHEKKRDFICGVTEITVPGELEDGLEASANGCGRSFTSKAALVEHVRTAHFNLPNKRAQREEKKKAKRQAEDDGFAPPMSKKRKPRKDKGVKKSSTLNALTGLDMPADEAAETTKPSPFSNASGPAQTGGDATKDDADDWNQLSGSMTLYGDHLYHNGQGYHFASEDGSADQSRIDEGQYMPCPDPQTGPLPADDVDLEPFFDFEHEREHIDNTLNQLIDPLLQQA
ncbi:hypothetical protein LTR70_010195 [Exophiala xenobiotica]|uniref:C2H2-type domain-containing protein n=1 Tax=Lithohypha guttulata TaxID=1690604 RepID=A0ABR0JUQ4_9EURO|nr:hypothetical protein LTR24_010180 [Lithohypha guttulata]KAK5309540.1 hypothetical protein LTR70_010195 [Exophiala xenobiotica]